MTIIIANRRSKPDNLRKKHGEDIEIIDVTSKADEPWVRFSPFWPHGNIPVPNPGLIQRPIVIRDNKAALGRPPEDVLEIL